MRQTDSQHRPIGLIGGGADETSLQSENARFCERRQDRAGLIGGSLKAGAPQGGDQTPALPIVGFCVVMFLDAPGELGRVGPDIFSRLAAGGGTCAFLEIPVRSSPDANAHEAARGRKLSLERRAGAAIEEFRISGL